MRERHGAAGDRPVSKSRIEAFWHCTRGNKHSAGLLPPAEICRTAVKMLGNHAGDLHWTSPYGLSSPDLQ